jgi:hypothetical protein
MCDVLCTAASHLRHILLQQVLQPWKVQWPCQLLQLGWVQLGVCLLQQLPDLSRL